MLQNLNEIVTPIKKQLERFNSLDCELPEMFKTVVHHIGSNVITYGKSLLSGEIFSDKVLTV